MKYLKFITLLLAFTSFVSCGQKPETKSEQATAVETSKNTIELIDFYGTHRCVTCKAIEANAKYTIDTYFKDEKDKGLVVFKTINVDDEANYDMAESFEAVGTALFINVIKDGKEEHIDLTDFAFSKGKEQEAFSLELKSKIDAELKKL